MWACRVESHSFVFFHFFAFGSAPFQKDIQNKYKDTGFTNMLWGEYSEEDLKGYWRDAMAAMGAAPKSDSKDVPCSVVADPVALKQLQMKHDEA